MTDIFRQLHPKFPFKEITLNGDEIANANLKTFLMY